MAQKDLAAFLEDHILPQIENRTEFREQKKEKRKKHLGV